MSVFWLADFWKIIVYAGIMPVFPLRGVVVCRYSHNMVAVVALLEKFASLLPTRHQLGTLNKNQDSSSNREPSSDVRMTFK